MMKTWTVDSKDSSFLKNSPAYVRAYTYAGNISLIFTVFTVHCPQIKQTQVVCPFNTDTDIQMISKKCLLRTCMHIRTQEIFPLNKCIDLYVYRIYKMNAYPGQGYKMQIVF